MCFVDVRTEAERAVSVIPGSISGEDFERRVAEQGTSWLNHRTVVPYCTIGYRSAKFTQSLQAKEPGLKVLNMAGSILMWTHEGGSLIETRSTPKLAEDRPAEVKKVHVYGSAWDLAPAAYEALRFS